MWVNFISLLESPTYKGGVRIEVCVGNRTIAHLLEVEIESQKENAAKSKKRVEKDLQLGAEL